MRYAQHHRIAHATMPALSRNGHRGHPLNGVPMSKILSRSRKSACTGQAGLCFYCRCAMWVHSADELTQTYGITQKQAKKLQCTAEHLLPRSEGGSELPEIIVAACLHCNGARHKRKKPPTPYKYLALVRSRVADGRWHPREVTRAFHGASAPQ